MRRFIAGGCSAIALSVVLALAAGGPALALGGEKIGDVDSGGAAVTPDPLPDTQPGTAVTVPAGGDGDTPSPDAGAGQTPAPNPAPSGRTGLGGGKKPVDEGAADTTGTPDAMPDPDIATPAPQPQPQPTPPSTTPENPEGSALVHACDNAAAHPSDADKPATVIGVDAADMNIARAIEACRAAHEAFPEHGRTAYQLGRAYHLGNRPRDAESAYFAALAVGYERAGLAVGFLYQDENALARDAADALAFFRRAADAGLVEAEFEMGWAYENGLGTAQDYAQAAVWYQRAADHGDKLAMNNLGWLYSEGHGVERDPERAVALYRPGAEAGIAIAQYNMGWALQNGVGIAQDSLAAADWYGRAADNGETFAMLNLGYMYLFGEGVTRDPGQALSLFRRADEAGSVAAKSYIGELYEHASEYYDPDNAAWYYVRALKGGDEWPITRATADWDNATARAVQRILKDNGFYTGPIDGVMGAGSVEAMKRVLPAGAQ
jgi:TPR repeat protein